MGAIPDTAHRFTVVARLRREAQHTADRIVALAHAARQVGATAESYRRSALELDSQADRAEQLLFGQAVETFRAAASENRLIADALDVIESSKDV